MPLLGEFRAVVIALQQAAPHLPLTILTDCLTYVHLMRRWARQDFRLSAEDKAHWDILADILKSSGLRQLTGTKTVVWVKGHCGDPGNTMADQRAD